MKKLLSVLLVLGVLMLTASAFAAMPEVNVWATGDVNVRESAKLDGKLLGTLKEGVSRPFAGNISIDDRGVTWYLVAYDDDTWGWVSSRYSVLTDGVTIGLSFDVLGTASITLAQDDVMRKTPADNGEVFSIFDAGTVFDYCDYSYTDAASGTTWYMVSFDNNLGWIDGASIAFGAAE